MLERWDLEIMLVNGSELKFSKSDVQSVRLDGAELFIDEQTSKTTTKKTRVTRGEPVFYIFDAVLRLQFPLSIKNQEVAVSKIEFDRITQAFHEKFDPMGRLRWKTGSSKELGANDSKVGAVRKFLIKSGVLKSGAKLRTYYGEKHIFLEQAEKAWKILQMEEKL